MIIKTLNLFSFGKFKNKTVDFSDSFNVVYGTNESGKSTIFSFIEAMLYSYPPHDKERGKYFPWDGSAPSGKMTFSHNSKTYSIFRTFGLTPKADKTSIEPFLDLREFLPDRETFRKTVGCGENKASDFGKTSEMDSRVSNILSTGDENISAKKAIDLLCEQRKRFIKPRGNSGELQICLSEISRLEKELSESRRAEEDTKRILSDIKVQNNRILSAEREISGLESAVDEYLLTQKELNENILQQNEYISHLSPSSETKSPERSFPFKHLFVYTICSLFLFIIGFYFLLPFLFASPLPLILFFVLYFAKKRTASDDEKLKEYREALKDSEILHKKTADISEKISLTRRQISFLRQELSAFREELNSSEKALLASSSFTPSDEIESELSYLKASRKEMEVTVGAIDAAIEAVEYASARFCEDFTPKVSEKAMRYLSFIAPKETRHLSLMSDGNAKNTFSFLVKDPLPQALSSYSFGFRQEVYICFRLALSEFLFGNTFPLIIDEPFLGSDAVRSKKIIELLCEISRQRQVILFTNRFFDDFKHLNCNFIDIDH